MGRKLRSFGVFVRRSPWQVRLSMGVMGLGQLCYGQIAKGLCYLSVFGVLLGYFVTRGFRDLIGFFTLGTRRKTSGSAFPATTR